MDEVKLDDRQQAAATSDAAQLLVVAGAGSGKTRTFVHRIAHLVARGADPSSILALSYTKDAAAEAAGRLMEMGVHGVSCTTVHAWCHRDVLRNHGHLVGQSGYGIMDAEAAENVLKYDMKLGEWGAKDAQSEISMLKNLAQAQVTESLVRLQVQTLEPDLDLLQVIPTELVDRARQMLERDVELRGERSAQLRQRYDELLARRGKLDFDDLQVQAVRVLREHPEILLGYRKALSHVLIDEYQDINPIQHELLSLLCTPHEGVPTPRHTVVGDGRQAIYSFRAADPSFIRDFTVQYPQAQVVSLAQNYRSTQTVIEAAERIVAVTGELGEPMWTENGLGPDIEVEYPEDPEHEAVMVAERVQQLIREQGVAPQEIAVLYRVHDHGPPIAQALKDRGLPFQIKARDTFEQELWAPYESEQGVQLRTIHAAKGLEYDAVILPGWVEGVIPSWRALRADDNGEGEQLAEEHRLAYVALTRSRSRLVIMTPVMREARNGDLFPATPSRFLDLAVDVPMEERGWSLG